jgi:pentatricopeptide repeat protein
MTSDGWAQITAAYNSIIICLCQHGMVKTALQVHDKMISKGFLLDSVSFAARLHGICLEGRSNE